MPRPLAGFFIAGEGDVGLYLAQDIADGRWLEFLANVSMPVDGAQYLTFGPDEIPPRLDELYHRMMCMASGIALKDPRIPNSLMPLPLDNQRDIDIAALHYVSLKTGGGRHIGKLPPGGLRGDAFWQKIVIGKHFDRYRRRSLNQLLKALRAQNDDYKV
jgi:hypothetical protein